MSGPERHYITRESGLILISSSEEQDPSTITHQMDRGIQRSSQFQNILARINTIEAAIRNGEVSHHAVKGDLAILQNLAFCMYADEISQEAFTKDLAAELSHRFIPNPQEVLTEAQRILGTPDLHVNEILKEAEYALTFHQKETSSGKMDMVDHSPAINDEQQVGAKNTEGVDNETTRTICAEYVTAVKIGMGELAMYSHDDVLDEPNEDAAAYVRELLEKPF